MAPHHLLLASNVMLFYFGGDSILNDNDVINITLERKQSKKAEMLVDLLYENNSFLYDIAHHFQDEHRYTISLLSDILKKLSLEELATMGLRESYLNSIYLVNQSNNDFDSYIKKLLENNDLSAIDVAIIILENNNIDTKLLKEKRNDL